MRAVSILVVHEVRNARASLCTAAFLVAGLLAVLHGLGALPFEIGTAMALLMSLLALQLSADSFATDLASGRLATRAALPVEARALCTAKLGFLVISLIALTAFGWAVELGLQAGFGRNSSLPSVGAELPPLVDSIALLALVVAVGMVASLLVESGLTALILASLALAALVGFFFVANQALPFFGLHWRDPEWTWAISGCAAAILALGAWIFLRGQRRPDDTRVGVRAVLVATLAAVVGLAGLAAAANWHQSVYGIEDADMQLRPVAASPDGRFVAIELYPMNTRSNTPTSAWVVDLDTGARTRVAWPGNIADSWTDADGLIVEESSKLSWGEQARLQCLRVVEGELRVESLSEKQEAVLLDAYVAASLHPVPWAEVIHRRLGKDSHELEVRWKGTEHIRVFHGNFSQTRIGRGVVPSPTPGRLIANRDGKLVWIMMDGEDHVLLDSETGYLQPSPDGQALLVWTKDQSMVHVLSTVDGSELHAPWPREEAYVEWIRGDHRSHELRMTSRGPDLYERVLDLDSGREIAIGPSFFGLMRVAERGYVRVDEQGDLVWIDRECKLVRVLVDRKR